MFEVIGKDTIYIISMNFITSIIKTNYDLMCSLLINIYRESNINTEVPTNHICHPNLVKVVSGTAILRERINE